MYNFLVIFHSISFITLLFASYKIYSQKYLSSWKNLLLNAALIIVYSFGYLLEVTSTSLDQARICLNIEYMGLSLLPPVFMLFISDICNYPVNKHVIRSLFLFGLFIWILVLTSDHNTLYYTSIAFEHTGMFPHLVMGHGPFYFIFLAEEFSLFIYSGILILRRRSHETNRIKRRMMLFLLFVSLLPMTAVIFNFSGIFAEYDAGPLFSTITLVFIIILILNSYMTDVVSVSLTNLYVNLGNGIIILDRDGKFLNCNYVASNIFPELHSLQKGSSIRSLEHISFSTNEEQFFNKDGLYYSASASRVFNKGDHVGYIISIVDMTQMHNQLKEMESLKIAADAASEAKSTFLATMSHEIRTPLNAIIGMSTLSEIESDIDIIKANNHQIKSAGEMLLDIVSEVLDISKAESGKLEIVPVMYDLKELLEGVINVTNMRIGDKPIKLIVNVNPNIPRYLIGDNIRIRQILINFLSNSEKYTDEGSITLFLDFIENNDEIILKGQVSDTGRGIKEEDINLLFKPFTQVDTKKNHAIMGTGLGLSIVSRLIELMNGTKNVTSTYGEGSCFCFTLPQQVAGNDVLSKTASFSPIEVSKYHSFTLFDEEMINTPNKEKQDTLNKENKLNQDNLSFSNKKVLIVDDNKVNLTVLSKFLNQFDINPDKCQSGFEAIEKVKKTQYDLIFMDQLMPEMDGIETSKTIRSLDESNAKDVTIIACTANVIKSALDDFASAGMNDFIGKPIIFDQLKEMLIKYLG